jgi:hypothetical protein
MGSSVQVDLASLTGCIQKLEEIRKFITDIRLVFIPASALGKWYEQSAVNAEDSGDGSKEDDGDDA